MSKFIEGEVAAWLFCGAVVGGGAVLLFHEDPSAREDHRSCMTYKVSTRSVTSYVLKPPPAEVVYKACPQTTSLITKASDEVVKEEAKSNDEAKSDEAKEEEKPRRKRHRHWRHWRHWR